MKRTLLYIATAAVIATTVFTSCGPDKTKREAHKMAAGYFMDFSRDLINLADIEVTYRNADGQIVIDTITSNQIDTFSTGARTVIMPDSNGVEQPGAIEEDTSVLTWPGVTMEFDSIPTRVSISVRILPKPLNEVNKDNRYYLYLWYGLSVAEDGFYWKTRDAVTLLDWVDVHGSNVGKAIDIANDDRTTLDCTTQRVGPNPDDVKTVRTK